MPINAVPGDTRGVAACLATNSVYRRGREGRRAQGGGIVGTVSPSPAAAPAVETATLADVDALLAFWEVAGENDARPTDSPEVVEALLRRDPEAVLVTRVEGRIVGTVIAGWDGWRAHLYRLAVHPDHRRRGIAQALLDAAETRLRALGAGRFDAMVLEGNDLGAAAWAARGYAPQPEWRRWVRSAPGATA